MSLGGGWALFSFSDFHVSRKCFKTSPNLQSPPPTNVLQGLGVKSLESTADETTCHKFHFLDTEPVYDSRILKLSNPFPAVMPDVKRRLSMMAAWECVKVIRYL